MADNKKDSTPINEEVLEETFGHYSEEMTSSSNGEGTSHETEKVAKKNDKSTLYIIVACIVVAIVYFVGKMVFGGSSTKPQAPQIPNKPTTPIAQSQISNPTNNLVAKPTEASGVNNNVGNIATPNTNTTNNASNTAMPVNGGMNNNVAPVAPNDIAAPASNVVAASTPVANGVNGGVNGNGQDSTMVKDFLANPNTNTNNNTANTTPVNSNVVAPVNTDNSNVANVPNLQLNHDVAPVAPTPAVQTPVVVAPANVSNVASGVTDNSQVALLNSIKEMIGNQTTELKGSIGGLSSRVDRLEKNSDVSKLNSSINDIQARLAKLESKEGIQSPKTELLPTTSASVNSTSTSSDTASSNSDKKEAKYTRTHRANSYTYTKKKVWSRKSESKAQEAIDNSDVLFTSQGAQPVNNTRVSTKPKATYVIHSMIPGQIWIKNPDGTQASYVVGDRLPNGDTIKKINVDKWSVETSSGVIR